MNGVRGSENVCRLVCLTQHPRMQVVAGRASHSLPRLPRVPDASFRNYGAFSRPQRSRQTVSSKVLNVFQSTRLQHPASTSALWWTVRSVCVQFVRSSHLTNHKMSLCRRSYGAPVAAHSGGQNHLKSDSEAALINDRQLFKLSLRCVGP